MSKRRCTRRVSGEGERHCASVDRAGGDAGQLLAAVLQLRAAAGWRAGCCCADQHGAGQSTSRCCRVRASPAQRRRLCAAIPGSGRGAHGVTTSAASVGAPVTWACGLVAAIHLLLPPKPHPTSRMRAGCCARLNSYIFSVNRSLLALKSAFHHPASSSSSAGRGGWRAGGQAGWAGARTAPSAPHRGPCALEALRPNDAQLAALRAPRTSQTAGPHLCSIPGGCARPSSTPGSPHWSRHRIHRPRSARTPAMACRIPS